MNEARIIILIIMFSLYFRITNIVQSQDDQVDRFISCNEQISFSYFDSWDISEEAIAYNSSTLSGENQTLMGYRIEIDSGEFEISIFQDPLQPTSIPPSEYLDLVRESAFNRTYDADEEFTTDTGYKGSYMYYYYTNYVNQDIEGIYSVIQSDFNENIEITIEGDAGNIPEITDLFSEVIQSLEFTQASLEYPEDWVFYFTQNCKTKFVLPQEWVIETLNSQIIVSNFDDGVRYSVNNSPLSGNQAIITILDPSDVFRYLSLDPLSEDISAQSLMETYTTLSQNTEWSPVDNAPEEIRSGFQLVYANEAGTQYVFILNTHSEFTIVTYTGNGGIYEMSSDISTFFQYFVELNSPT